MNVDFSFDKLVIQPTTLCNLDCRYCYLPNRNKKHNITVEITAKIANDLAELAKPITLIWHGGEPLSCGLSSFSDFIEPFRDLEKIGLVHHAIQTNATLIDRAWCDFFKAHNFRVGVSIDGPKWANVNRVNWNKSFVFEQIMKGIECLKENRIPFNAITVITKENIKSARELYSFFSELGCYSLGVNIEEIEGANQAGVKLGKSDVIEFWSELFGAWRINPSIEIREFARSISWMTALCFDTEKFQQWKHTFGLFPTIAWNGNVVVLSPELLGAVSQSYDNFVVGNVTQESLKEIIRKAQRSQYVKDFIKGVARCKETCSYYSFCRGGHASNKFYELGTLDATQTLACQNSKQYLVDSVLDVL